MPDATPRRPYGGSAGRGIICGFRQDHGDKGRDSRARDQQTRHIRRRDGKKEHASWRQRHRNQADGNGAGPIRFAKRLAKPHRTDQQLQQYAQYHRFVGRHQQAQQRHQYDRHAKAG